MTAQPPGRWFEQLPAGLVVEHATTRTVTLAEFPAPVFAGDTIHVVTEVAEARKSRSRPDTGIVTFEHRGNNQRDELVCRAHRAAMMRCGPGA